MEFLNTFFEEVEIISNIHWGFYFFFFFIIFLIVIGIQDIRNKRQTIKHNFPVLGRLRYMLESIGPELRQYIVANNREELPFNRSQRSWIYASSKQENNYSSFGTDKDLLDANHIFINPAMFPYVAKGAHPNVKDPYFVPCAKVMGLGKRRRPFRPHSVVNISAMSYGSLSPQAVEALNKGAKKVGCYHNTGEGGYSDYHNFGADVVFHFGTGYFGCRDLQGNFSLDKLAQLIETHPNIRAIEVKLSQGAKPGKGGVLPGKKITPEIARIRGVEMGKDVLSPAFHSAFSNVPELVDFIERIGERTGLPVGIKSAIGKMDEWHELAHIMKTTGRGPDFITVDGGEGGTGAAPPAFADHVSLPFIFGFAEVYKIFVAEGITDKVVFIGSGKLGFPANALKAFSMGVDVINVARESMMAIGCIQAQKCHTNNCPTGIATNNKWLTSGLDPTDKSNRFYNYIKTIRKEILEITHACGYEHPCQMGMEDVDIGMGSNSQTQTLKDAYGYEKKPIDFKSVQSMLDCPHLGSAYLREKAKV